MHCQVCGCTDDRACVTEQGPCFWASRIPPVCSACAPLVAVVADILNRPPADVRAEQNVFEDLGGDELDRLEIAMGIQEAYRVGIDDDDYERFQTIGDLIAIVQRLRASRVRAA